MSKPHVERGGSRRMRAKQQELTQNLLEHPDVFKVFEKVMNVPLHIDQKNHVAAQQQEMYRLLPISTFENNLITMKQSLSESVSWTGLPTQLTASSLNIAHFIPRIALPWHWQRTKPFSFRACILVSTKSHSLERQLEQVALLLLQADAHRHGKILF